MLRAPVKPGLRQNRREDAGVGRLAGLHPLGQGAVEDALAVAGGVAVGDAESGQHLFRCQPEQLARRRSGAEDPHRRGAVPAAVHRAGQRDAARHVEPERDRQQQILPGDARRGCRTPPAPRPTPRRRDGSSRRCRACRRNPARDPCWRSTARPGAPAGGYRAAVRGFPPARPNARSPQRARRSPANRCRRACSRRCRGCRGGPNSTALAGKSGKLVRHTCCASAHAGSSVIVCFHRFRSCDITRFGEP